MVAAAVAACHWYATTLAGNTTNSPGRPRDRMRRMWGPERLGADRRVAVPPDHGDDCPEGPHRAGSLRQHWDRPAASLGGSGSELGIGLSRGADRCRGGRYPTRPGTDKRNQLCGRRWYSRGRPPSPAEASRAEARATRSRADGPGASLKKFGRMAVASRSSPVRNCGLSHPSSVKSLLAHVPHDAPHLAAVANWNAACSASVAQNPMRLIEL